MPIFDILKESLIVEEGLDLDLGNEEEEAVPAEEETGGDAEALVNALIKYAPGKETEIKSMLKYAANSNPDQDIFDEAFAHFESLGDTPREEPTEEPAPEEAPREEPSRKKAPAPEELSM